MKYNISSEFEESSNFIYKHIFTIWSNNKFQVDFASITLKPLAKMFLQSFIKCKLMILTVFGSYTAMIYFTTRFAFDNTRGLLLDGSFSAFVSTHLSIFFSFYLYYSDWITIQFGLLSRCINYFWCIYCESRRPCIYEINSYDGINKEKCR